MLEYGIIKNLINDVPAVYKTPEDSSRAKYTTIVDVIPEKQCSWNDDIMDFNPYFKYHHTKSYILNFSRIDEAYRPYVKEFILNYIDEGNKIPSAQSKIYHINAVIKKAIEISPYHLFEMLKSEDILQAIELVSNNKYYYQREAQFSLWYFYEFMSLNYNSLTIVDSSVLRRALDITLRNTAKFRKKHSALIPDVLLDNIMTRMDELMRDKSIKLDYRMVAGMILLNTQLGLRISELIALDKDCLHSKECLDGVTRDYIVYNSFKSARARIKNVCKTICTPIAKNTLQYLLELRKQYDFHDKVDQLLIQNSTRNKLDIVKSATFSVKYQRLCCLYLEDLLSKDWPDIPRIRLDKRLHYKKNLTEKEICIPNIHSYRVTFASNLYAMGINIDYINAMLNHSISSDVNDAYIVSKRPIDKIIMNENDKQFEQYDNFGDDR